MEITAALRSGLLAAAILAEGAAAADATAPMAEAHRIGIAQNVTLGTDGTLTLADGRIASLSGIELARVATGAKVRPPWSEALEAMLASGPVELWQSDSAGQDRWGRWPVQATLGDGRWVQGELLARGLARVRPAPWDRTALAALLAAERPARETGLGLWDDSAYAVRRTGNAMRFIDSYQVFSGRVTSTTATRGAIYLDLGDDRRRALGVRIPRRLARDFSDDPVRWTGRYVLVRGWVGKSIGPLIEIVAAGQIECVAAPSDAATGKGQE